MGKKKLLVAAFYFPPILSGGVFRPLKFVKYLGDYGWEPTVLTVKGFGYADQDEDLLHEVPDHVEILRTRFWSFHLAKSRIKCLLAGAQQESKCASRGRVHIVNKNTGGKERTWKNAKTRLVGLLGRTVEYLLIPDEQIVWVFFSLFPAVKEIRRKEISMILTTSPPNSAHLLGLLLKKLTGVKWVVDFRDPWFSHWFDLTKRNVFHTIRRRIEGWLEKLVVRSADKILCVSHGEREILCKKHALVCDSKVEVITNGYDADDFSIVKDIVKDNEGRNGTIVFCHCGYLYKGTADEFFDAIEALFREEEVIRRSVEIRFVGQMFGGYRKRIEDSPFRKNYRLLGQVRHKDAIRNMQRSDVLLILLGGDTFGKEEIPGKTFEYMANRKMILAVTRSDGDVAEILKRSGLGIIVSKGDVENIKRAICMLAQPDKRAELRLTVKEGFIQGFERRKLTQRLAELLDQVMEKDS